MLVEQIVVAMGDELKAYIPSLVHPVLRLFLQDKSPQRVATQKVRQEGGGEGRREEKRRGRDGGGREMVRKEREGGGVRKGRERKRREVEGM